MLRKCYQKCVGLIIKIPYLRTSKLSKDWLDDIRISSSTISMSLKAFSAFPGRAQPKISTWFSKPNQSLI